MSDQKYLGSLNAFVLCIDSADDLFIDGRIYHLFDKEPIEIHSYKDLFLKSEGFFDSIGCPRASQSDRDFNGNVQMKIADKELIKMNKDDEILEEHGELGTFIVRVQHRQHSSWQGRVTWLDEDKTVYFRSELELMKLIDEALNKKENA